MAKSFLKEIEVKMINKGRTKGQAIVTQVPFSFVGDFDPKTGLINHPDSDIYQLSITDKILVCPAGRGGTLAPIIAYEAKEFGNLPKGIICSHVDPLLVEAAIVNDITLVELKSTEEFREFENGQNIEITEKGKVFIS